MNYFRTQTTYICIHTHGTIIPTEQPNPNRTETTVSYLIPPTNLTVNKLSIACPGTTGFGDSPEYSKLKALLNKDPYITPEVVTPILIDTFNESKQSRIMYDRSLAMQGNSSYRDTTTSGVNCSAELENERIINKVYDIDTNDLPIGITIEIMNGQFKGQNILSYNFLRTNLPKLPIYDDDDDWYISNTNEKIYKKISLDNLLKILASLKLKNVYLLDPSCNVSGTSRDSRAFKLNYMRTKNQDPYQLSRKTTNSVTQVEMPTHTKRDQCINCVEETLKYGSNCCKGTGKLLATGATNISKGTNYLSQIPVSSMRMDSRTVKKYNQGLDYKQYDSVYIMVNGRRCQGNIRQVNGNNAIVDIDPDCSNGISTQTVSLDQLEKMGGRKIKTKRNKKGKMKNNKRNKTTKKYRRKRTLKK
jgi:hypothetical protein